MIDILSISFEIILRRVRLDLIDDKSTFGQFVAEPTLTKTTSLNELKAVQLHSVYEDILLIDVTFCLIMLQPHCR